MASNHVCIICKETEEKQPGFNPQMMRYQNQTMLGVIIVMRMIRKCDGQWNNALLSDQN